MYYIGENMGQKLNRCAIATFMPCLTAQLKYILEAMITYIGAPELMIKRGSEESALTQKDSENIDDTIYSTTAMNQMSPTEKANLIKRYPANQPEESKIEKEEEKVTVSSPLKTQKS